MKFATGAEEDIPTFHPRSALHGCERLLLDVWNADPNATLTVIRAKLAERGVVVAAESTIWISLKRLGIVTERVAARTGRA